jgi:hypothetical protein
MASSSRSVARSVTSLGVPSGYAILTSIMRLSSLGNRIHGVIPARTMPTVAINKASATLITNAGRFRHHPSAGR